MDGCKALSRALEVNKTLIELDLTCNRISKDCLEKLMGGLKRNSTLEILRVRSLSNTVDYLTTLYHYISEIVQIDLMMISCATIYL